MNQTRGLNWPISLLQANPKFTNVKNWAIEWMNIITVQQTDGTRNGQDKSLRDSPSHILNGNDNDKPTGMLWELNEIVYVEGLANQIGKNNVLVFINSKVCQCLSKIGPWVWSMLSGEGITPMTDGHGGPSARSRNWSITLLPWKQGGLVSTDFLNFPSSAIRAKKNAFKLSVGSIK